MVNLLDSLAACRLVVCPTSKSIRAAHDFESTNRLIGIGYDALFDFFGRDRGDSYRNDGRPNARADRSAILKAWSANHLRGRDIRAATATRGANHPNPAPAAGAEESREPENHRLRASESEPTMVCEIPETPPPQVNRTVNYSDREVSVTPKTAISISKSAIENHCKLATPC